MKKMWKKTSVPQYFNCVIKHVWDLIYHKIYHIIMLYSLLLAIKENNNWFFDCGCRRSKNMH